MITLFTHNVKVKQFLCFLILKISKCIFYVTEDHTIVEEDYLPYWDLRRRKRSSLMRVAPPFYDMFQLFGVRSFLEMFNVIIIKYGESAIYFIIYCEMISGHGIISDD